MLHRAIQSVHGSGEGLRAYLKEDILDCECAQRDAVQRGEEGPSLGRSARGDGSVEQINVSLWPSVGLPSSIYDVFVELGPSLNSSRWRFYGLVDCLGGGAQTLKGLRRAEAGEGSLRLLLQSLSRLQELRPQWTGVSLVRLQGGAAPSRSLIASAEVHRLGFCGRRPSFSPAE